jgi:hypothetical protein
VTGRTPRSRSGTTNCGSVALVGSRIVGHRSAIALECDSIPDTCGFADVPEVSALLEEQVEQRSQRVVHRTSKTLCEWI